jgi:hypothetical protein
MFTIKTYGIKTAVYIYSKIRDKSQQNSTSSMVVKDIIKLFMYWRRVVRMYVEITIGVKTG